MRERHRVLLQHRRFVLVHPHDRGRRRGRSTNLSSLSSIVEQVVGDDVERIGLERRPRARRARAGSSPVRSRCMPRSASVRGVRRIERQRASRQRRPLRRTGSCAPPARRRRGRPRRSAARSPAPSPTSASNSACLSSTYAIAASSACASRLDGLTASALLQRLARLVVCGRRRPPAARGTRARRPTCGLISSACFASSTACGGLSSASASRGAEERRARTWDRSAAPSETTSALRPCCTSRGTARPTPC